MYLKELRKKNNIKQVEIAQYLNINQEKYSRLESEKSHIDIDTLIKIADFYKVTLDELVGHEVPYLINKSLLTDKQTKLIEYVTQLTDSQCDKVEAFIIGISMAEIERQDIIQKFKK